MSLPNYLGPLSEQSHQELPGVTVDALCVTLEIAIIYNFFHLFTKYSTNLNLRNIADVQMNVI